MGTSKQLATFEQIFRGQEEGDILALLNATDAFIMVLDAKGLVLHLNSVCCLLYTSDAADDLLCVDLGGRRIIKKQKNVNQSDSIVIHKYINERTFINQS